MTHDKHDEDSSGFKTAWRKPHLHDSASPPLQDGDHTTPKLLERREMEFLSATRVSPSSGSQPSSKHPPKNILESTKFAAAALSMKRSLPDVDSDGETGAKRMSKKPRVNYGSKNTRSTSGEYRARSTSYKPHHRTHGAPGAVSNGGASQRRGLRTPPTSVGRVQNTRNTHAIQSHSHGGQREMFSDIDAPTTSCNLALPYDEHDNGPESLNEHRSPCDAPNGTQARVTHNPRGERVVSTELEDGDASEGSTIRRWMPHISGPRNRLGSYRNQTRLVLSIDCPKSRKERMVVYMQSEEQDHEVSLFLTYGERGLMKRRDLDGHVGVEFIGRELIYKNSLRHTEKLPPHDPIRMTVTDNDYEFSENSFCRFAETNMVPDHTRVHGVMGYISKEDMKRLFVLREDSQDKKTAMTRPKMIEPTLPPTPSSPHFPSTINNTFADHGNARTVGSELIIRDISWKAGLAEAKKHHDWKYAGTDTYSPWRLCTKSLSKGRKAAIKHTRDSASPPESDEGEQSTSPVSSKFSHSSI